MLKLPPEGHAVRQLIDMAVIESMTESDCVALPTLHEERRRLRDHFARERDESLVTVLILHESGKVLLMSFGARGGYRLRWNFGRWREDRETAEAIQ